MKIWTAIFCLLLMFNFMLYIIMEKPLFIFGAVMAILGIIINTWVSNGSKNR